jgi:hypothetical protein
LRCAKSARAEEKARPSKRAKSSRCKSVSAGRPGPGGDHPQSRSACARSSGHGVASSSWECLGRCPPPLEIALSSGRCPHLSSTPARGLRAHGALRRPRLLLDHAHRRHAKRRPRGTWRQGRGIREALPTCPKSQSSPRKMALGSLVRSDYM